MESYLRSLRIIHGAMLFAAVLYVFIAEKLKTGSEAVSNDLVYTVIAVQAVAVVMITFILRKRFITDTEERLREAQPGSANQALFTRWRTGHILCFAFAESVVLFGMVLRFLGTGAKQVFPFYLTGILLFLFLTPRRPQTT